MKYFRAVLTTNAKQQGCQGTISDIELSVDGQVEEPDETAMPNNNSQGKVTSIASILRKL